MFKRITIRQRLTATFIGIFLVFIVLGSLSLNRLDASNAQVSIIAQDRLPNLIAANTLFKYFSDIQVPATAMIFSSSASEREALQQTIDASVAALNAAKESYQPTGSAMPRPRSMPLPSSRCRSCSSKTISWSRPLRPSTN